MTQGASLAGFIDAHQPLLVLTGAGCSTDSGIPDYRDDAGQWRRRPPVTHQEFLASPAVRQRYWARSLIGWPIFQQATPNAAHHVLADLEKTGHVSTLVTQNVDGLHLAAGQMQLIEIHGNITKVVCLNCGERSLREHLQQRLEDLNPRFNPQLATLAPDGDADADFSPELLSSFVVPACRHCGGVLKPDVVFFGDNIPRPRAAAAMNALETAAALLVIGSSLMVYSGFRFCQQARTLGKPIAVVNRGVTRADHLVDLKLEAPCAEILTATATHLALPGYSR